MRPVILLQAQLRTALPRSVRRDLNNRLFTRLKTTQSPMQQSKSEVPFIKRKEHVAPRNPQPSATAHAKATFRRGPPEKILIYHAGTGRTVILGALKITTVFLVGASCLILAPAFAIDEYPWYWAPAISAASTIPMIFVMYTSAPFVNFIHIALPVFARRSRETALEYAKNLPPTATLYINTMKVTTVPKLTEVRLGDLVASKSLLRPVSFANKNPVPRPWWKGRTLSQFYAAGKSHQGKQASGFFPEVWEHVYKQIQSNGQLKKH
ncbi:hypothetical protein BO70DRAFT_288846 [Aspergillus heteromorphus CBS 117.55]|uniref:Uncharacterized protein n=1 Tax=Aspergillus heteromorphus CBS 117.55 TaxID=1448321 RepID=A0A317WL18_9EURO|nr:uncharacterized protein BO70DRAFT_288846 [Aspergillus heteromorphus CBS 117.55]PWY86002.1 hypothetical protein BO70DRAFT_288846 [Aspergillus heteromorphus CBS 117.55]